MGNPIAAASVGEVLSTVRDGLLLLGFLVAGWKARSIVQPIVDFFKQSKKTMVRANLHMDNMEASMDALLNNHLKHLKRIETDLDAISGVEDHRRSLDFETAAAETVEPDSASAEA